MKMFTVHFDDYQIPRIFIAETFRDVINVMSPDELEHLETVVSNDKITVCT